MDDLHNTHKELLSEYMTLSDVMTRASHILENSENREQEETMLIFFNNIKRQVPAGWYNAMIEIIISLKEARLTIATMEKG
jgi:precorrin-3B methylase